MANAIYPKYKEAILNGGTNTALVTGTVKVALRDTGTLGYNAAHDFQDDVSTHWLGTAQTIAATKSVTNGTFATTTLTNTFTSVAAGGGTQNAIEALDLFIDTGTPATSRLVCFLDTGVTGLPVTLNGGNITITWDGAGIFTL